MSQQSKKYFLVKIDIGGKQKYIFSTNVLKDIIGASEIIRFITEELGQEVLKYMNELKISKKTFSNKEFQGDNGNVLIEAGGNSIYIFEEKEHAITFNKIFSKFVMKYFDGIELLMVIQEFDIEESMKSNENPSIKYVLDHIEKKLTLKKGNRKNLFKRISFGLTKMCSNTKKPAGYMGNKKDVFVSKESYDKQRFYKKLYEEHCKEEYYIDSDEKIICNVNKGKYHGKIKNTDFYYITEVDELAGDIEGKSYVGITCIDGNGMGEKINSFYKNFNYCKDKPSKINNLNWLKAYRNLTREIKEKYEDAFSETIEKLCKNYDNYKEDIFQDNKNKKILPIRPIILAGDDITFISNGKIAIETTKIFADNITKKKVCFGGNGKNSLNLTVSCGVAIVGKKYPFSRAVKLAGELEKSSKKKLKKVKDIGKKINKNIDASFIDWYVDRGNILEGLNEIRSFENLKLTGRPYMIPINNEDDKFKSISDFIDLDKSKDIFCYKFNYFYRVLNIVKRLNKNSNLREFYRAMNKSEVDANLFSIKYLINKDFQCNDLEKKYIEQVIYDVIEVLDLYEEVEYAEKEK